MFAYTNLRLSAESITANDALIVTLDVTNTGERSGHEIVQCYIRDIDASVTRPEKELKGFAKVLLQPGETATVAVELAARALAYYNDAEGAWVAEVGTFEVLVGSSAQDIRARATFTLAADWVLRGGTERVVGEP